jgi:hypothetical protein
LFSELIGPADLATSENAVVMAKEKVKETKTLMAGADEQIANHL